MRTTNTVPGDAPTATTRPHSNTTLRDHLSVPYRVEAWTAEVAPGYWVRRARYAELPDCVAEAVTIEAALELLERRRIETLAALLTAGRTPPVPRPPLPDVDAEGLLRVHGLDHLIPSLDKTAVDLRR